MHIIKFFSLLVNVISSIPESRSQSSMSQLSTSIDSDRSLKDIPPVKPKANAAKLDDLPSYNDLVSSRSESMERKKKNFFK